MFLSECGRNNGTAMAAASAGDGYSDGADGKHSSSDLTCLPKVHVINTCSLKVPLGYGGNFKQRGLAGL